MATNPRAMVQKKGAGSVLPPPEHKLEKDVLDDIIAPKIESAINPTTQDYNPAPTREIARVVIASALLALFAAVLLVPMFRFPVNEAKEIWQILVAPVAGLVGSALGFYYGGNY